MNVGSKIQMFLDKKHISQNDLAKKAELSQSGLSSIVNNRVSPKVDTLEVIARALDCSICELLDLNIVTGELTSSESQLIDLYRHLDDSGKERAFEYLSMLQTTYPKNQSGDGDAIPDMAHRA